MPIGGFSYQPGAQDNQLQPRAGGGQNGQTTVPQQAIRTLSLRVPQAQNVPGLAPLPLMNARGGGGSDLDMLLTALLRAFGGGALQPNLQRGGSAQAPRIIPGVEEQSGPPVVPLPPPNIPRDTSPRGTPPLEPLPTPKIPRDFPPRGPREPYPSGSFPAPDTGPIPNDFPDLNGPITGPFPWKTQGALTPLF